MNKRSIKSQVVMTIVTAMFMISVAVGGISIYEVKNIINASFEENLLTESENAGAIINSILQNVEKTGDMMAQYVAYETDVPEDVSNEEHVAKVKQVLRNITSTTDGVVKSYLKYNSAMAPATNGVFYVKDSAGNIAESVPASAYVRGEFGWKAPYFNDKINKMVNAYEAPIYVNGKLVGVAGIELDYGVITDAVAAIKLGDNGYGYLELAGKIASHPELEAGSVIPDTSLTHKMHSTELSNGMKLIALASLADIEQKVYQVGFKIWGIVIAMALLFVIMAFFVMNRIVSPLKKLTNATDEIANGNYNIKIDKTNIKELASLSAAFEKMAAELRENEMYMRRVAYRDPLTKLRNVASYKVWVEEFNNEIKINAPDFGVVVLDLNGLKEANDAYGHEFGNKLIFAAAQIMSEVFKHSPIFRIGGDEFVVVLTGTDLEYKEMLSEEFDKRCNREVLRADDALFPISIAKGIAYFDSEKDTSFIDVFNRADDAMYENKRKLKA